MPHHNPLRYTDSTGLDVNLDCSKAAQMRVADSRESEQSKGAQFTVGRDEKTGLLTAV